MIQSKSWSELKELPFFFFSLQRFGSLRSDDIEQMRFKQRLKVIQSLEDTAKRSVVSVDPDLCLSFSCLRSRATSWTPV